MKDSNQLETPSETSAVNEWDDIKSFHGNPDIVDFPSTSEIFEAVFENTYYANCIGNGYGQTIKANERACELFGYTPEEMRKLSVDDLFETERENYTNYISVRDCERKATSIITGIRKNGDHFPCEISSLIYFDDNGEKRTLNTLHDLSKSYSTLLA